MSFSIKTEEEYVPTSITNPDNEQPIKFHLKYLNSIERDSVTRLEFIDGKSHVTLDWIRACKVGILRIENLIVGDRAIVTADQFLTTSFQGCHDAMLEVGRQIILMNPLPNGESLKNSP